MSNLWDREPGADTYKSVKEEMGERLADRVSLSLPSDFRNVVAVAQVATDVKGAIESAAGLGAGASVLGVAGAIYSGLASLNGAFNKIAKVLRDEIGDAWSGAIDNLTLDLINKADGRILALYQPADDLTLKRPQAKTSSGYKDGKIHKLTTLVDQYRPGYVVGIKRPGRSDFIASTVNILTYPGETFNNLATSIYGDDPPPSWGTQIPASEGWDNSNRWNPLGLSDAWTDAPLPEWVILAAELKNARACPPLRWKILVAPGLAPFWGPQGQQMPAGPRMVAYAAALLVRPPPDLDLVVEKLAAYAAWNETIDVSETGILELLWSREDQARRGNPAAGKPRGDEWPGPFKEIIFGEDWNQGGGGAPKGPGGEQGQKKPGGGMGGKGPGGIKGDIPDKPSGGGGALLGLGLGALALGGGAIVARQVFGGKKKGRGGRRTRSRSRLLGGRRRR